MWSQVRRLGMWSQVRRGGMWSQVRRVWDQCLHDYHRKMRMLGISSQVRKAWDVESGEEGLGCGVR